MRNHIWHYPVNSRRQRRRWRWRRRCDHELNYGSQIQNSTGILHAWYYWKGERKDSLCCRLFARMRKNEHSPTINQEDTLRFEIRFDRCSEYHRCYGKSAEILVIQQGASNLGNLCLSIKKELINVVQWVNLEMCTAVSLVQQLGDP